MRGLGKPQIKQRKKTENKIKNFLKRRRVVNVNEIIREVKMDPTAIIGAIKRLVKEGKLIQYKHKNRKLVGLPTPMNRYYFNRLKKVEEKERRSKAQKEIIIAKLVGTGTEELKESKKFLEKNTLDLEVYKVNDQLRDAYYDNDKDKWLELYEKYDKLCIKLLKLHGIPSKSTPMERKIKQFKFGLVGIPVGVQPIGSEISLTLVGDTPSPFHKKSNQR